MPAGLLDQILPGELFGILLIFMRVGGALTLMPGFAEQYVSPRIRLILAVMFSVLLEPILVKGPHPLPAMPGSVPGLALLIGGEALIGATLGLLARFVISALDTAGMIISQNAGLANATMFNPTEATQGTAIGSMLGVLGITLIFVTNLHHLLLGVIAESYDVFPAGALPPVADLSAITTRLVAQAFQIALGLAAPFMVLTVVFFAAMGLIGRLMPQLQIFFVAAPLQILGGLIVLAVSISAGMLWFLGSLEETLGGLLHGA